MPSFTVPFATILFLPTAPFLATIGHTLTPICAHNHSHIWSCFLAPTPTRSPAFIRIRPLQSIVPGSNKTPIQQPLGATAASATTYSASRGNNAHACARSHHIINALRHAVPKHHVLSITTRNYGWVATPPRAMVIVRLLQWNSLQYTYDRQLTVVYERNDDRRNFSDEDLEQS